MSKQIALITGANRGLGSHLAEELLARGAKVYAGVRKLESIDLPGVIPLKIDITDEKSIAVAAEIAKEVTKYSLRSILVERERRGFISSS
ncbi:SDR family NAD(P)-dependent oxidoreductase [Gottfriedia acidiceleris]|uniref:SDR family NAD(P)-dependent oxidoreductase n=1 Tax=Bacillaceae TaxID=186817 RepID=UPI00336C101D